MIRFVGLIAVLASVVYGYELSVLRSTEVDGIDFLAPGTFNVNGFNYCGCPSELPELPESNELLNTDTNTIDLNSILNCVTSFDADEFCSSPMFEELTINVINAAQEDVVEMCDAETESCDAPDPDAETIDDITINFFVPDFCRANCFLQNGPFTVDGETTPAALGVDFDIFSSMRELTATVTLQGEGGTLTSDNGSGSSVTCTGTQRELESCLSAITYAPMETSEMARTVTALVDVRPTGDDTAACSDMFTINVGAVEQMRDVVVTEDTTFDEDRELDTLVCSSGTLTIADGVTVTVLNTVELNCILAGPGVLIADSITCDGGTIGAPTTISDDFIHSSGQCSITAVLTCVATTCTFGTTGGTLNVGAVPVGFDAWLFTGGIFVPTTSLTTPSSASGQFTCAGATIRLSTGITLRVEVPSQLGDGSGPVCTLEGSGTLTLAVAGIIEGLTGLSGTTNIVLIVAARVCPDLSNCVGITGLGVVTGPIIVGPEETPSKAVTQQVTEVPFEWTLICVDTCALVIRPLVDFSLSGGCTLGGEIDVATGSNLGIDGNTCTIQSTSTNGDGRGTVEVDGGTLTFPCSGETDVNAFTWDLPTTVMSGSTLVFATEGDCQLEQQLTAEGGSNVRIGPNDVSANGGVTAGDQATIVLVFEPNSPEFGQLFVDADSTFEGPQTGTAILAFEGEQNADASTLIGRVLTFIGGTINGNVQLQEEEITIGSGTDTVDVVRNANGVQTGVLSTMTTTDNNNGGGGGVVTDTTVAPTTPGVPSIIPAAPSPPTAAVDDGDDGSNSGLIGGLVGGIGGGLLLLLILAAIAGAVFVAGRKNRRGGGGPMMEPGMPMEQYPPHQVMNQPFESGLAAQPNTPVEGPGAFSNGKMLF